MIERTKYNYIESNATGSNLTLNHYVIYVLI